MTLEFGIWDHFERLARVEARQQYDERIALVRRAEELGFHGYHVAEHHLSPLSMTPSPLMFLAALARETSRIRLGSMIVIVPLYPTIRLAEDICVLDALSGGRLELGVGRGIRDGEHEWWGDDPTTTRDRYVLGLERIRAALTNGKIEVEDPSGTAVELDFVHEPTQRPTPPFWYVGNFEYAAEQGMRVLADAPQRADVDAYYTAFEERRRSGSPFHQGAAPLVGATRPIFVDENAARAEEMATRAWSVLGDHFWATDTRVAGRAFVRGGGFGPGGDIHDAMARGRVCFGTPETVRAFLGGVLDKAGPHFTYLVNSFQWGDLTHTDALGSLELFWAEVAPALREQHDRLR